MKSSRYTVALLFALAVLAGCASTKVTEETPMRQAGLARPNTIYVYNFASDQADIPPDSSILSKLSLSSTPPSQDAESAGRELGAAIAQELVADINAMGLNAVQVSPSSPPQVAIGDGVIRGYIVSAEGGSTAKRFVIGFGSGTSEMDTVVEGYVMTANGLEKLGSGTLNSSGNKTPGMVAPAAIAIATGNPVGLIVMGGLKVYGEASGRNKLQGRAKATADQIADQLKIRFRERGWIS
jgi:Domain of unknown function (DUF4410)